jgi:hypothetical protein
VEIERRAAGRFDAAALQIGPARFEARHLWNADATGARRPGRVVNAHHAPNADESIALGRTRQVRGEMKMSLGPA